MIGNVPEYKRIEMFSQRLRTAAPITGGLVLPTATSETFDSPLQTTIEEWISEQKRDPTFEDHSLAALPETAFRHVLYLHGPDDTPTRSHLGTPQTREPLVRFMHEQMFHLGHAKVAERLLRSYFWPTLKRDTRRVLNDCPDCEIEKERQNQAHGLFRARPHHAPRSRFAIDFQGQARTCRYRRRRSFI